MTSKHKARRISLEERHQSLKTKLANFPEKEQAILKEYFQSILTGIERATINDGFDRLDGFETFKEKFFYELLELFMEDILSECPPKRTIEYRAKRLTSRRKKSWFAAIIRQKETIQANAEPSFVIPGDDGAFCDVKIFPEIDWQSFLLPASPYIADPEECLCQKQLREIVTKLPSSVRASKRKRSPEWAMILDLQLSGKDVLPEHKEQVGANSDKQLREWKSQAFDEAGRCLAVHLPELEIQQALYKEQRGKKYQVQKSTFKKRKNLHRKPRTQEMEPKTIRLWKVIDGKGRAKEILRRRPDKRRNDVLQDDRAA